MNGRKPTADEQKWIDRALSVGCIVCKQEMGVYSPAELHHLDGCRKPNAHFKTIPLCYLHHRSWRNTAECVSRHPYKKAFEDRYGTEEELLEKTKIELE